MSEGKEEYLCETCAKEQDKLGKPHRVLHELSRDHLIEGFKKDAPAFLCYYCDGDAYQLSIDNEAKKDVG